MLGNLFGKLFGSKTEEAEAPSVEYQGFTITPVQKAAGGQFHTCGVIRKQIDGVDHEAHFIRADTHPTAEQAAQHCLSKGKQLIDEQGERLFEKSNL